MIEKGILFGEEEYAHSNLYAGFYDNKIENPEILLQLLKKTGDYTDRWIEGRIVNLFEDSKQKTETRDGITVITLSGFVNVLHGRKVEALGEEGIREYQNLINKITVEFLIGKIDWEGKIQQYGEKKIGWLRDQMGYVLMTSLDEGATPPTEEPNLLERIEITARETGLDHLIALPCFKEYQTTQEKIFELLERARKGKHLKSKRLYFSNLSEELPKERVEKTLSLLND